MPKFGSHIIFAELARKKRPDLFVAGHDNSLRIGAIGPDTTLFLFDPATSSPDLRKGITEVLKALEIIQDVVEEVQKVAAVVTNPATDLANWITGGLYSDVKYLVNASTEALILVAKAGIGVGVGNMTIKNPVFDKLGELPPDFAENPNLGDPVWNFAGADTVGFPFRFFGHPYTDDGGWKQPLPTGDYSEWWWMDLLHYRRTGQFANQLLRNATTPTETIYAQGYMTHVAGDISGHPFINSLVRGPFRNHAYRHLVVETLADTWLWNQQGRGDVLGARFDKQIDLSGAEEQAIASLIVRSMRDIYKSPMVPSLLQGGYPTESDWISASQIMKTYLRLSTSETMARPEPPPDSIEEVFEEMKKLLKNNIPGPLPRPGTSIKSFLKALFNWIAKGLTLLIMLVTLPVALVNWFATAGARWLLYLINQSVYMIISSTRTLLCLSGWGYASIDDFKNFGFLDPMITTGPFNDNYPYRTLPIPKDPFYWLVDPSRYGWNPASSGLEERSTRPFSPDFEGNQPDIMVDPRNMMRPDLIERLINAQTPEETRILGSVAENGQVFGNAVDFSIALLEGTIPVADFDLDGDRGFGFKGWEELPPNERYV